MTEQFDAIVVGMGPGGETVAETLIDAGKRVAVVEKELIGGECPYWACMPSKTLLRPVEARAEASRVAGLSAPAVDWPDIRAYRDVIVGHHDDSSRVAAYRSSGATVVKGEGKLAGPGEVTVNGGEHGSTGAGIGAVKVLARRRIPSACCGRRPYESPRWSDPVSEQSS